MEEKMSRSELIKRYVLFIISLFVSAVGVAVTKRGELGVSPHILCSQCNEHEV